MAPTDTSQWQEISGLLHAKCATTILVVAQLCVLHAKCDTTVNNAYQVCNNPVFLHNHIDVVHQSDHSVIHHISM